jgi:hypothetical protein
LLLSSLSFGNQNSHSTSHCIHALHSWKLGQPKLPGNLCPPHRVTVQTHLDQAYLSALIRFALSEADIVSLPMARLSFITSALLVSQTSESNRLSWLAGVWIFRACLLCLRSSSTIELAIGGVKIGHHVERRVKVCIQVLGRICISFAGLGAHKSVCEMLADLRRSVQLPVADTCSETPQDLIGKLPSFLSRNMAMKTLSALSITSLKCPIMDEMVTFRVSRFLAGLSEDNEEDKTLYRLVIGCSE